MNKVKVTATFLMVCGFAFANIAQVDSAATRLEGSAEHFHDTAHYEMPGSHIDQDAHELAEQASWFHDEVHHGHSMYQLKNMFRRVKDTFYHASHTMYEVHPTPHVRADFNIVRRDVYNVDHAFYWGGHHGGGGHGGWH